MKRKIVDGEMAAKLNGKNCKIIKKLGREFWLCEAELDGQKVLLRYHLPLEVDETEAIGRVFTANVTRCDDLSDGSFEIFGA